MSNRVQQNDAVIKTEAKAVTEAKPATERLASEQVTALAQLASGKTVGEAAQSSGVSRATVYRWLKCDAVFRTAFNQWQDELTQGCRSRLLTLTDKAASAIEKSLEKGDAKTALQLLKGLGLLTPAQFGPTEVEEVKKTMEIEHKNRQIALVRAEGRLKLDMDFAKDGF